MRKIFLEDGLTIKSKILINASGPWINKTMKNLIKTESNRKIRLVKGSHIITKKLYEDNIAFTLQNDDGRIVFVIPFKEEFSLIGTTEVEVNSPDDNKIDEFEKNYLIDCVNNYFIKQICMKRENTQFPTRAIIY